MSAADRIRIQHMLDASREAMAFAKGRTVDDLRTDRMLLLALVKEIEILGEAATQISEDFRLSRPEIPWAEIRGMRNRLIHAYSDVNVALVWSTVISDLPELAPSTKRAALRLASLWFFKNSGCFGPRNSKSNRPSWLCESRVTKRPNLGTDACRVIRSGDLAGRVPNVESSSELSLTTTLA